MFFSPQIKIPILSLICLCLITACGAATPTPAPTEAAAPTSVPATATPEATAAPTEAAEAATPTEAVTPTEAAEATTPTEAAPAEAVPAEISFSQHVVPVLEKHCLKCHGGERTKEGFEVNSYDSLMAGSDNGEVVTPGDSSRSEFIKLIDKGKMPPRKEPRLTPEEIKILTDWVNAGALNN